MEELLAEDISKHEFRRSTLYNDVDLLTHHVRTLGLSFEDIDWQLDFDHQTGKDFLINYLDRFEESNHYTRLIGANAFEAPADNTPSMDMLSWYQKEVNTNGIHYDRLGLIASRVITTPNSARQVSTILPVKFSRHSMSRMLQRTSHFFGSREEMVENFYQIDDYWENFTRLMLILGQIYPLRALENLRALFIPTKRGTFLVKQSPISFSEHQNFGVIPNTLVSEPGYGIPLAVWPIRGPLDQEFTPGATNTKKLYTTFETITWLVDEMLNEHQLKLVQSLRAIAHCEEISAVESMMFPTSSRATWNEWHDDWWNVTQRTPEYSALFDKTLQVFVDNGVFGNNLTRLNADLCNG